MSEYEQIRQKHNNKWQQLGDDLKVIRARCHVDRRLGLDIERKVYDAAVRVEIARMEVLEARYAKEGSKFSRVYAESLLESYLRDLDVLQHAA